MGTLLLVGAVAITLGFFLYPEGFLYGAGLAGIGAILAPVSITVLGVLFMYGSFKQEKETKKLGYSDVLVDEWIDEQDKTEEEITYCRRFLSAEEKLLALLAGQGASELNRLAMTDKRIILYPINGQRDAVWFSYLQVTDFRGKQNNFLHHLGEIVFLADNQTVKFGNVGIDYINQAVSIFNSSKKKAASNPAPFATQSPPMERRCPKCGQLNRGQEKFCGACGTKLS